MTGEGEHAPTRVGVLGSSHQALVDAHGAVAPDDTGWQLDWWIGADDRWHVPEHEAAVRQTLLDAAPVVETSLRVPGGDAVQRVYGVGGPAGLVAIEIENASGAPFVVAFVIRPRPDGRVGAVETRGSWVEVDGRPALLTLRPAMRWSVGESGAVFDQVSGGLASAEELAGARDRAGNLEAAFLHPVPHRNRLRCAVVAGHDRSVPVDAVDLSLLPEAGDAAAGWAAQLRRGMQVVLPDARLQQAVDAARASLLLAADARPRLGSDEVAALEDWGFDREAEAAWRRLGMRERRRAGRRQLDPRPWQSVRERMHSASATFTWPDGPATLLRAVRDLLVAPHDDDSVALLVELPTEWRGQSLEVHDAPTRAGRVSYAVRWHGPRPALLWECERPIALTVPGLDPAWSTRDARGEALLAAPADAPRDAGSFT
ncbi:MAG: hypothetical protein M3046_02330 [Actinomycetota bacterium]|nr:hypothetical protein [Actinomycetota bacterium]